MDKDKHMKKGENFAKEGCAYVHCEVKNGITQLAVSGDSYAIVYACYRTLKRTTELTGAPFEIMVEMLEKIYHNETGTQIREV